MIWKAERPGKWLIHCHIPHHTTNNNVEQAGGGGLMMVIDVSYPWNQPGSDGLASEGNTMFALLRRAAAIWAVIIAIAFALSPHAATAAHAEAVVPSHVAQHSSCDGHGCPDVQTSCCGYSHCVAGLSQALAETLVIVETGVKNSSIANFAKPAVIRRLDRPPKAS